MTSRYRQLLAWQNSIQLIKEIYSFTRSFPSEEQFVLTSQVRRAAISIASNTAESQGRFSRKECRQFLLRARGSLYEVETHIVIAQELGYLSGNVIDHLFSQIAEIERLLNGLIRFNS